MTEHQSDHIIQRLDRLERENWYWKRATLLLLIVIGSAILMGQALKPYLIEAERIKAQRIELIDDEGGILADLHYDKWMSQDEGGTVILTLQSKNAPTKAELSVNNKAVLLNLHAKEKYSAQEIQALQEHDKKFNAAKTPKEMERVGDVPPVHGVQVFLSAHAPPYSKAELILHGWQGDSRIELTDQKGTQAVLGNTELNYLDTGSVEQRPASSLVLFNKDRKVIWKTQ